VQTQSPSFDVFGLNHRPIKDLQAQDLLPGSHGVIELRLQPDPFSSSLNAAVTAMQ
jgi:hypothetical protein